MMDMRNPSEVTDAWWVWAQAPSHEKAEYAYSGKWMLFPYTEDLDSTWATIRDATAAGTLGTAAKAATARENPLASTDTSKLICVYTRDHRDIEDVRRVLARLRDLGFTHRLSYKTDDDTISGKYGSGASLYTSQPNTTTFGLTSVPKNKRVEL
jgi:hypothetical protein